jgi:hypothetical protein
MMAKNDGLDVRKKYYTGPLTLIEYLDLHQDLADP